MGPGEAFTNGECQASDSASKPGFPPNSGAHYRWLGYLGAASCQCSWHGAWHTVGAQSVLLLPLLLMTVMVL